MLRKPLSGVFLDVLEAPLQLYVFGKHRPHANKGTYCNNTGMNCDLATQDVRCHDGAMLGEHIGSITTPAFRWV
jgi:hypothetical protein